MQAYLSLLDVLIANFTTLMLFEKDATTHTEESSKFCMIMTLIGLPPKLNFARNLIISGSTLPNYDTDSE